MSCSTGYAGRRRGSRAIAILSVSFLALGSAPAQAATFVEPVFGLLVDQAKARYLPLAPDIARRCNLTAGAWLVFAHAKDKAGDLYIVQVGDAAGSVLRVSPAGCAVAEASQMLAGKAAAPPGGGMAQAVAVQSGAVQPGETQVPKALLDDAVLRAQQANGGPAAFKAKACQPAVMRDIEAYPAVRSRLGSLCGM